MKEPNEKVLINYASNQELVALEKLDALAVFTQTGCEELLETIKKKVDTVTKDVTTEEGRDEIRAVAYKIARSKTALDKLGAALVKQWKDKSRKVDGSRKFLREELDALKEKVRQPLTEFEERDHHRVAAHQERLKVLRELHADIPHPMSLETIGIKIEVIENLQSIDAEEFTEQRDALVDIVLSGYTSKKERLEREEEERKAAAQKAAEAAKKLEEEQKKVALERAQLEEDRAALEMQQRKADEAAAMREEEERRKEEDMKLKAQTEEAMAEEATRQAVLHAMPKAVNTDLQDELLETQQLFDVNEREKVLTPSQRMADALASHLQLFRKEYQMISHQQMAEDLVFWFEEYCEQAQPQKETK